MGQQALPSPDPLTPATRLFPEAHDDESDDQAVQRDGFHQREPDPHILSDAGFRFRLARHRFDHLPEDVPDTHTGSGKPCRRQPHAQ